MKNDLFRISDSNLTFNIVNCHKLPKVSILGFGEMGILSDSSKVNVFKFGIQNIFVLTFLPLVNILIYF